MKKIINTTVLTIILFFAFILNPIPIFAWDDCPMGKVNDTYPGDCPRYVDTDNNGICDHSEPAPEDRINTIEKSADNVLLNTDLEVSKDPLSKPLLAILIVAGNLLVILSYAGYKKYKSRKP